MSPLSVGPVFVASESTTWHCSHRDLNSWRELRQVSRKWTVCEQKLWYNQPGEPGNFTNNNGELALKDGIFLISRLKFTIHWDLEWLFSSMIRSSARFENDVISKSPRWSMAFQNDDVLAWFQEDGSLRIIATSDYCDFYSAHLLSLFVVSLWNGFTANALLLAANHNALQPMHEWRSTVWNEDLISKLIM